VRRRALVMTLELIAGVLSLAVAIYLLFTLLRAEDF
jgi:K+-transporting ATPase KdpF subunit